MKKNNEIYPVVIPDALLLPEIRKLNGCSKYILFRIIGLSKRCTNKQVKISNSLIKYEMGYSYESIRKSIHRLEALKLISIERKDGCRRVINVLFDIESLKDQQLLQASTEENKTIQQNGIDEDVTIQENSTPTKLGTQQSCIDTPTKLYRTIQQNGTHKYEYKKEEIDIYRKKVYKKIINDLSEGSIEKIFMRDPETNNQLASFIPFSFDPKEDVDRDGQCIYTNEPLDEEGYNLHQWIATNITYLADLCLFGKYGEDAYSIYAESLLKRWNPKKASLGKFLNVAVQNDFKGFRTKAIDYVQSYIDREIVSPVLKKFIKQRNSPSKVLDAIAFDYPQYFAAVMHDMDLGRYLYRLMYQTINDDCEDVFQPFDSNRDFPSEEERKIDWGQKWFDAWSVDPESLSGEARETASRIIPFHKGLYEKGVMFDAFFN